MKTNKLSLAIILLLFTVTASVFAQQKKEKTVVFSSNMHCVSCQQKVEKNLSYEKGVKDLVVDLKSNTIKITFDVRKTSEEKLALAITKLGYEAKVIDAAKKMEQSSGTSTACPNK
jgi:copper chaperone CopZ